MSVEINEHVFDKAKIVTKKYSNDITVVEYHDMTEIGKNLMSGLMYVNDHQEIPACVIIRNELICVNRKYYDINRTCDLVLNNKFDLLDALHYYMSIYIGERLEQAEKENEFQRVATFTYLARTFFPKGGVLALIKFIAECRTHRSGTKMYYESMNEFEMGLGLSMRKYDHLPMYIMDFDKILPTMKDMPLINERSAYRIDYSVLVDKIGSKETCRWKEPILLNPLIYLN